MSGSKISEAVRTLIAERIDSIPELEAILLLREYRTDGWTAEDAGKRLYVSPVVAAHLLRMLAGRGFFACADEEYRYAPETAILEATVDQLAEAYSDQLIEVTSLVHAKPSASVRQFAEAFRFRKDK